MLKLSVSIVLSTNYSVFSTNFTNILARWDEYTKIIQFMLNIAVVGRHGMSSLFFFFGRQPQLPASPANSPEAFDPAALDFVLSFKTRLQEALDIGRLAQSHLIEKMDKHRDPGHAFAVGIGPMWILTLPQSLAIRIFELSTQGRS